MITMTIIYLIGMIFCLVMAFLLKPAINHIIHKRGATSFEYLIMGVFMAMSAAFLIGSLMFFVLILKNYASN